MKIQINELLLFHLHSNNPMQLPPSPHHHLPLLAISAAITTYHFGTIQSGWEKPCLLLCHSLCHLNKKQQTKQSTLAVLHHYPIS
jgi:hypothetical protein